MRKMSCPAPTQPHIYTAPLPPWLALSGGSKQFVRSISICPSWAQSWTRALFSPPCETSVPYGIFSTSQHWFIWKTNRQENKIRKKTKALPPRQHVRMQIAGSCSPALHLHVGACERFGGFFFANHVIFRTDPRGKGEETSLWCRGRQKKKESEWEKPHGTARQNPEVTKPPGDKSPSGHHLPSCSCSPAC